MIQTSQHKKTGSGRRLTALLLALLLTACVLSAAAFPAPLTAQAFGVIADDDPSLRGEQLATEYMEGIFRLLEQRYGVDSLQEILDASSLTRFLSPWYAFSFSQYGSFDFTQYDKAWGLNDAVRSSLPTPVERQRDALFGLAFGNDVSLFLLSDIVGRNGIMSLVFALHLINNGATPPDSSAESVIRAILDTRLEDGGWAITGQYGDVDVTSMTLQALAPWRTQRPSTVCTETISEELAREVADATDRALALLSSRQNPDAGFTSYGNANVESSAQVLVLLSALGIDACTDSRFIKGGRTVLDAISDYRLTDGSFCHVSGGEANDTATQQVCYACLSYLRFRQGKPSLYDLDAVHRRKDAGENPVITELPIREVTPTPTSGAASPTPYRPAGTDSGTGAKRLDYRVIGSIVIAVLLIGALLLLRVRRRLTRRNGILILILTAALLTVLWVVKIQTPEQYYASLAVSDEEAAGAVTLSIRCDTVAGLDDLPADGVMLAPVKIAFREGDTVFDALSAAAAKANLPLDIGSGSTYIRSIGSLREFAYGTLSGWMYYVNGEAPTESCGQRKLRDGDVIEWRYTRDMGADTEER